MSNIGRALVDNRLSCRQYIPKFLPLGEPPYFRKNFTQRIYLLASTFDLTLVWNNVHQLGYSKNLRLGLSITKQSKKI